VKAQGGPQHLFLRATALPDAVFAKPCHTDTGITSHKKAKLVAIPWKIGLFAAVVPISVVMAVVVPASANFVHRASEHSSSTGSTGNPNDSFWTVPVVDSTQSSMGYVPGSYCVNTIKPGVHPVSAGSIPSYFVHRARVKISGRRVLNLRRKDLGGLDVGKRLSLSYTLNVTVDRGSLNPSVVFKATTKLRWLYPGGQKPRIQLTEGFVVDAFGKSTTQPAVAARDVEAFRGKGLNETFSVTREFPCQMCGRVLATQ
jgi:hypothetical protein